MPNYKKGFSVKSFDSYSTKRVSYILTTKNRANFLGKALSSYERLVKTGDELIVIDGGSTDGTERIIKKYADLVQVFVSEPDMSSAHALNKGMLLARGKYIKHLTDDDVIYPESMEKAIGVLEEHPEIDLLVCGGTKQRGSHFFVYYVPEGANFGHDIRDVYRYGACGVGHIIRRKSLALTRLHPLDIAADVTLTIQCIATGLNVKFCRINLFHHPVYDHSTIIAKASDYRKNFDRVHWDYLPKKDFIEYKFFRIGTVWWGYVEKINEKFPLTRAIFWPVRILIMKISKKFGKISHSTAEDLESLISNKRYKWDGGFS
jgi:glycosyltransferase involved in cell wall biosynthesis